ncbi:hypothetical protein RUM44_005167 [Polyplax serrata]|uniref:Uncharacterized protein n=1 Tax=Polyplax serrata TaxID=468196 RepID=A0ABR1AE85_POLSC
MHSNQSRSAPKKESSLRVDDRVGTRQAEITGSERTLEPEAEASTGLYHFRYQPHPPSWVEDDVTNSYVSP